MAKPMVPSVTIENAFTVTPTEMTDPRVSYKISIPNQASIDENQHEMLQKRMHIILCYKKQSDEDSGWHVGGWIKESLSRALVEAGDPFLAGRLRGSEDGGFELVSNDSGVRMVEAQMALRLVEFLELSKVKHEVEGQLVYWKDVEATNAHFSPLFSIQVTNFQCGGYTIGITYSLLLADPVRMAKILNKWADIHRSMAYEGEIPQMPVFYTPHFKRLGCSSLATNTTPISSHGGSNSKTIIFNVCYDNKLNIGNEICSNIVLPCIEEAETKVGKKMSSHFTLITKDSNGETRVEKASKQRILDVPKCMNYELQRLCWEDLRINEMVFQRKNVAINVSHWIACDSLEGVVLVVIGSTCEDNYDINIYVTFPNESDYNSTL